MNKEFLHKMLLAKKYEKEALIALLSPSVAEHVQVIEREVKGMVTELIKEWAWDISSAATAAAAEQANEAKPEKKVKKVTIG